MTSPTPTEPNQSSSRRNLALVGATVVVALIALGAFVTSGNQSAPSTDAPSMNAELADTQFATVDGGTTTLSAYQGTPVVLNFFAAYCGPCRAEMPDFETVSQERAGTVTFLGVSRDLSQSPWLSIVEETGVTFETVFEGTVSGAYTLLEAKAMPTTAFIDADGTVLLVNNGPLDEDRLNELIDELFT